MLERLVGTTVPEHELKFGKWGALPPNFKEITEAEFAASMFFIYSPGIVEYRQIQDKAANKDGIWELRMYFYHDDTGLAIAQTGQKKVRYFKFAVCEHVMAHTSKLGNCLNRYTCGKCGYVNDVDSSG